jgi:drug/metabolite transporter (DMT)-like permease
LLLLGLLSVGCYNALQYLALQTSTPINVTLVGSSLPVWMLAIGLLFGAPVSRRQLLGAALSVAGVLVVLARGEAQQLLQLRLVPGDLYMLAATLAWAAYSWLLTRPGYPASLRAHWAGFLMAQVVFGLPWAGAFALGEALWMAPVATAWGWPLAGALLYIALGPSLTAYLCWGAGVRRVGPSTAGFFANLTPLFAVLLSGLVLHEPPRPYHAFAFALIVGGIVVSSRRRAGT